MAKQAAVLFRRKVYVAPLEHDASSHHMAAMNVAFAGMSDLTVRRIYDRVEAGKENIVFGYAFEDGSEFVPTGLQDGRKRMYGFT